MVHEPGGINGDEFGVVSDEGEVVRGGELDGPAVPAVDDFDLKRLGEDKCGRKRRIWKRLIMMIELADVCVEFIDSCGGLRSSLSVACCANENNLIVSLYFERESSSVN